MKKLRLVSALVLGMSLSLQFVYAEGFKDVKKTDWFAEPVNTLADKGGIKGYADGMFKPMNTISKGEFVTLIVRAMGYEPDVLTTGHWSGGSFTKARTVGLLKMGELNINVDGPINRYDMALMVARALEIRKDKVPYDYEDYKGKLLDYNSIPEDYADSVLRAVASGVLGGYPDKNFHGDRSLTRAEAAVVITRLLNSESRATVEKPSNKGDINLNETKPFGAFFTDIESYQVAFLNVDCKYVSLVSTDFVKHSESENGEVTFSLEGDSSVFIALIKDNKIIATKGGRYDSLIKETHFTVEKSSLTNIDYLGFVKSDDTEMKMIENPYKQ